METGFDALVVALCRYWRMVTDSPLNTQEAVERYGANLNRQLGKLDDAARKQVFEAAQAKKEMA